MENSRREPCFPGIFCACKRFDLLIDRTRFACFDHERRCGMRPRLRAGRGHSSRRSRFCCGRAPRQEKKHDFHRPKACQRTQDLLRRLQTEKWRHRKQKAEQEGQNQRRRSRQDVIQPLFAAGRQTVNHRKKREDGQKIRAKRAPIHHAGQRKKQDNAQIIQQTMNRSRNPLFHFTPPRITSPRITSARCKKSPARRSQNSSRRSGRSLFLWRFAANKSGCRRAVRPPQGRRNPSRTKTPAAGHAAVAGFRQRPDRRR